jgi:hypothetical protein
LASRPPKQSDPAGPESHPQTRLPRRSTGGARKELTERVTIRSPGFETQGWTLNVSRGGFRAIVEEPLSAEIEYEIIFGESQPPRRATVVWSQEQNDGQIVGMKYLDDGGAPPLDELPPEG